MKEAELRDALCRKYHRYSAPPWFSIPGVLGRVTVISEKELDREGVRRLFYSVLDAQASR